MAERVPCEFFLIRYVPDLGEGRVHEYRGGAARGREGDADDRRVVRFTRDWTRVRCMDADADMALLEALEGEIDARLRAEVGARRGRKPVLEVLEDSLVELGADLRGAGLPGGERCRRRWSC